jgi:hypothetical protein
LYFVLVFTNGCSNHQNADQTGRTQSNEVQTSNAATNETTANEVSPLDRQIHDFFQITGEDLQTRYGADKGEALASIATAKEFKKTIFEVCRIYDRIENLKMNIHLSDAEIDALNIKRFKDIGFVEREDVWYFENQIVNMGNPLPTPESMKPQQPDENKQLEVTMETEVTVSDLKTLQVKGKTNLPDQTDVMIYISCPENGYEAGDKAVVMGGRFESSWFSNSRRPLNRLEDGQYIIEITTPTVQVLDPSVKKVLGEDGRNMTGKLIQFDSVLGNRMIYTTKVYVQ